MLPRCRAKEGLHSKPSPGKSWSSGNRQESRPAAKSWSCTSRQHGSSVRPRIRITPICAAALDSPLSPSSSATEYRRHRPPLRSGVAGVAVDRPAISCSRGVMRWITSSRPDCWPEDPSVPWVTSGSLSGGVLSGGSFSIKPSLRSFRSLWSLVSLGSL